jgi:7,8-dihydropterin-6-yl-methyl-4-(beta-D-ribofuranosyl)aminobenzene 5'-phosphate synthase
VWVVAVGRSAAPPGDQRLTILVDAFGSQPALRQDWGYAALVEYGGKRILSDTGNDPAGFAAHVRQRGVELTSLDAVVISHRHGDHTAGLDYLLSVNPGVRIYVPDRLGLILVGLGLVGTTGRR